VSEASGESPRHLFLSHRDIQPDNKIVFVIRWALEHPGEDGAPFAGEAPIRVYQAKVDYQLGLDIRKKIFPNILSSVGLVALWTSQAAEKPDWVLREIRYARRHGKLVALLVQPGIDLPPGLPKYVEHFRLDEFGSDAGFGNIPIPLQIQWITRTITALRPFYANGVRAETNRSGPG